MGQPPLRTPSRIFVDWFDFCVEISSLRSFRLLYTPTGSALLLLTLHQHDFIWWGRFRLDFKFSLGTEEEANSDTVPGHFGVLDL